MTYTIELNESEERVLEDAARRRGVALDVYLREVLKRDAQREARADGDIREPQTIINARLEAMAKLQALVAGTREGLPSIPLEELTSESLYAGRGEIIP